MNNNSIFQVPQEYEPLGVLGTGGQASVIKVVHKEFGYFRAIRKLKNHIEGENDKTYKKFLKECKILLTLGNGGCPNIMRINKPFLFNNAAMVEMDYIKGVDIYSLLFMDEEKSEFDGEKNEWISKVSKLAFVPVDEVLQLVSDISRALAFCHYDIHEYCMDINKVYKYPENSNKRGQTFELEVDPNDANRIKIDDLQRKALINEYAVIHNDIQSCNIMRKDDGGYILIDFGLAGKIDPEDYTQSTRETGVRKYWAPERFDNIITTQTDIYSLGILMYEMLTGRIPFCFNENDKTQSVAIKLFENHRNTPPPAIFPLRKAAYESVNPDKVYEKDYPEWLEQVIFKCLEKKPENRFVNGKELYEYVKLQMQQSSSANNEEYCKLKEVNKELTDNLNKLSDDNSQLNEHINVLAKHLATTISELDKIKNKAEKYESENEKLKHKIEKPLNSGINFNVVVKGYSFTMVYVEGSTFTMGCTSGYDDEKPVHSVTLSSYYIGEYEVTQALWIAVTGNNPSKFKGDNLPVEMVSWNDVQDFIFKLNRLTGKKFRLPTEAEWEYAARGGKKSKGYKYSGSNTATDVAWYGENSNGITHPVGTKQTNELGIYDMSGNVGEWCQDWYDNYSSVSQTNPIGALSGVSCVIRGGSWDSNANCVCVSVRGGDAPSRHGIIGFRLACSSE